MTPFTPQQVWDAYRKDSAQDMWEYSPILREAARGNILEIGVRGGVSTAAFLLGLEERGGHLFSVDINPKCRCLFDHPDWTFIHADSRNRIVMREALAAGVFYENRAFDDYDLSVFEILLVDGLHSFEGCLSDLQNYGPLVKSGGKIFVHDVTPRERLPHEDPQDWPTDGPIRAFNQFIAEQGERIKSSRIIPGQFGMGEIEIA